jgi:hypothetical protein
MKRHRFSFNQLVEKNKQEILKDKLQMEKIEKQIDKKYEHVVDSPKQAKV